MKNELRQTYRPKRHFTRMNESHHTWKMSYVKGTSRRVTSQYESVISHMENELRQTKRPTRHFTCMHQSFHTWKMSYVKRTGRHVTSHVWMSHITHTKWAMYGCVISRIHTYTISYIKHTNKPRPWTYRPTRHFTCINESFHTCDFTCMNKHTNKSTNTRSHFTHET